MLPCSLNQKENSFSCCQGDFLKVALSLGVLASLALVGLGVSRTFAPINDVRSIALMSSGGFLAVTCLVKLIILSCQSNQSIHPEPASQSSRKSKVNQPEEPKIDLEVYKQQWQQKKADFVRDHQHEEEFREKEAILCEANGDKPYLREYISKKAGINTQDDKGKTALFHAVESGQTELVQYLIDEMADKRIQDNQGKTPYHRAVELGHFEIAKLLYFPSLIDEKRVCYPDCRETRDKQGKTTLYCMAEKGDLAAVQFLIEDGIFNIHARSNGQTALRIAEKNGHQEVVAYLKSKGADGRKNEEGNHPLAQAVWKQNLALVRELVKQFNPNDRNCYGSTTMAAAAECLSVEIMKCLLENGGDLLDRSNYRTLLMRAVDQQPPNHDMVKYLIQARTKNGQRIDLDATDYSGINALYLALVRYNLESVELLLKEGAKCEREAPSNAAGTNVFREIQRISGGIDLNLYPAIKKVVDSANRS